VVHNTALNSSDNLPFYPPYNYHSSDDVYRRGGVAYVGVSCVLCAPYMIVCFICVADSVSGSYCPTMYTVTSEHRSTLSLRSKLTSDDLGYVFSLDFWLTFLNLLYFKVKVKRLDIYIPPLTWTWPAAINNWSGVLTGNDSRWHSTSSGRPLPEWTEWTDFGTLQSAAITDPPIP